MLSGEGVTGSIRAEIVVLRVKDHSLGTMQVAISRLATFLTL
jgi:hypothetical protein